MRWAQTKGNIMTNKPKAPDIFPENIPDELKAKCQWAGWRYESKQNKRARRFVSCRTGCNVRITSRKEFVTFDEAVARYRQGDIDGIAFAAGPADDYNVITLPAHEKRRIRN